MEAYKRRLSARVLDVLDRASSEFCPGVLVTLVHTEGSCYQKAGAQLFLDASGFIFGLVSGGCLEQAILDKAETLLGAQYSQLEVYDTGRAEEGDFSYGLGCGGSLWAFFEKIGKLETLERALGYGGPDDFDAVIVASERTEWIGLRYGQAMEPEAKLLFPTILDRWLHRDRSMCESLRFDTTNTQVAVWKRPLKLHLAIFGAGPGAWPLAQLARNLNWDVSVYDHRAAYLEDFPRALAHCQSLARGQVLPQGTGPSKRSAAVVMTHNFSRDGEILRDLVKGTWGYIGVLGSRQRWQILQAEYALDIPDTLRAPAGLLLGGDDIYSIALSIIAEIQAALYGSCAEPRAKETVSCQI